MGPFMQQRSFQGTLRRDRPLMQSSRPESLPIQQLTNATITTAALQTGVCHMIAAGAPGLLAAAALRQPAHLPACIDSLPGCLLSQPQSGACLVDAMAARPVGACLGACATLSHPAAPHPTLPYPLRACLGACATTPGGMLGLWRAGLSAACLAGAAAEGLAACCDVPVVVDPGAAAAQQQALRPGAISIRDAALDALLARLGPCLCTPDPGDTSFYNLCPSSGAGAVTEGVHARVEEALLAPASNPKSSNPEPEPGTGAAVELARAHAVEALLAAELPTLLGVFRAAGRSAGAAAAARMSPAGHVGAALGSGDTAAVLQAVAELRAAKAEVHASAAQGRFAEWVERWTAGV